MNVSLFLRPQLLGSLALLAACSTPPPAASLRTQCTTPRPQVCTMIYAPVCALHEDGRERSHASGCNACADDTAVDYREGSCEETGA
jgi:hypothetical protein